MTTTPTLTRAIEAVQHELNEQRRFESPGVLWPRTLASMPRHGNDPTRLRPLWRQTPNRLLRVLLSPVGFWTLLGQYEGERIVFDRWQSAWLSNMNRFRCVEKAPQIGFSWLSALEALHECMMFQDVTAGFVSVDAREATEKILYARKAFSELPSYLQNAIPMVRDSVEQLDFGDPNRPSRLMSIPASSAMRGRRMSVYLDESDFYRDGGREAFRISMGRVTRGGRVTMGSTCFGLDTQLDKVMQGEERGFSRARLPWVIVEKDDVRATIEMAIAELDPDDAAEEYECRRGGSASDTFSAKLILTQTHELEPVAVEDWEPGGAAVAGYDVGKSRNPSVLTIVERGSDKVWRQTVLTSPTKPNGENLTLPDQHVLLRDLMTRAKNLTLVVDAGGIGAHIAQALTAQFGDRVVEMMVGSKPQNGPSMAKMEMVTELKRALESDELRLVQDRDQATQFNRTRLRHGSGGVEQLGPSHSTHYDRFWACAYAWYGVHAGGAAQSVYNSKKLIVIGRQDADRLPRW